MAKRPTTSTDTPAALKGPRATVRMYRAGFGDCFLVSIESPSQRPFHMLIDCGIWQSDRANVDRLVKAVEHVKEVTRGFLDVLVVTHEHKDHVSGFGRTQAAGTFETLDIGEVWLAWTENMSDRLARRLRRSYMETHKKLTRALKGFRASAMGIDAKQERSRLSRLVDQIEELLGCSALSERAMGAAPEGVRSLAGMDWVKQLGTRTPAVPIRTWKPGQSIPLPLGRALVLGPPRREASLRKEEANAAEKREDEVYTQKRLGFSGWALGADSLLSALEAHSSPDAWDRGMPFRNNAQEGVFRLDHARNHRFFRERYFKSRQDSLDGGQWRRIDGDWLGSAAEMALRMQEYTNNTSLVLALELGPSKKVLLFPGDAQFGNWASWDDVKFEDDPDLTAEDLLRRTVLYKVGHHGSHNATLRKRGLERMTSHELTAMVPVDAEFVKAQKWNMPFPPMFADLVKRTHGRVLRSDHGRGERPASVSEAEWAAFIGNTSVEDDRYVECRIDL